MSEDRSLDDFVGAGASEEAAETPADTDEDSETDEQVEPDEAEVGADEEAADVDDGEPTAENEDASEQDVEPPSITATWNTDGVVCDRCDAAIERRWKCDGDLVCADCKDW